MHGCIPRSEPKQSLREFERLVQILRTLYLGLGVRQIRSCSQGPGRLRQCCSFGKKGRGEPGERFWFGSMALENLVEQPSFLARYAHTLAVYGVEPADRVTERKHPVGEFLEPVEMPPKTGGKPSANNFAKLPRLLYRIVGGLRTKPPRVR